MTCISDVVMENCDGITGRIWTADERILPTLSEGEAVYNIYRQKDDFHHSLSHSALELFKLICSKKSTYFKLINRDFTQPVDD